MEPEGIILVNFPITTFQQSLTHSAMRQVSFDGAYPMGITHVPRLLVF